MIDTIIIRLHNLDKYKEMIRWELKKNDQGYRVETGKVATKEVQVLEHIGAKDPKQTLNILRLRKTGEFLVKTETGKRKSSSAHYEFSYRIDWTQKYLEMNFSIPKYWHGTNVLMYVEHCWDKQYKMWENAQLQHNINRAPYFFMEFIDHFFKMEFTYHKVDFHDVEINRIDVCFNQVFKTQADALYYLKYQKNIRKKHSRGEGSGIEYGTSLMHTTQRYSEKIYHKGSEYKKNDLKHHRRINNERGVQIFNIEKIQNFADRILRYELTLRNAELNYLFKNNLFRKHSAQYKIDLALYKRIGNTMQRNDRIAKEVSNLPKEKWDAYKKLHPYEMISQNDRRTYKYVSHLIETSPKFMLKIDYAAEVFNNYTVVNDVSTTALFSKELIALCLKKLSDFINDFQLKELPNEEVIALSIDKYNRTHRQKLPKADMIQFYLLLVQTGSFKEANRLSRYSHATLYRYKARLKKIGITEGHIKPEENFEFPEARIDLRDYQSHIASSNMVKRRGIKYELY